MYKHGFNGLVKMQKEMQRFDYQPKGETVTPQFSAFQCYEMFSFIHVYNPKFSLPNVSRSYFRILRGRRLSYSHVNKVQKADNIRLKSYAGIHFENSGDNSM